MTPVEVSTSVPTIDFVDLLDEAERRGTHAVPAAVRGPWTDLKKSLGIYRFQHIPQMERVAVVNHRKLGSILCSPDGIFSHHANRRISVSSHDGLAFQEPFDINHCRPRHAILHFGSFQEAAGYMQPGEKGQRHPVIAMMQDQPTYRYFRQNFGDKGKAALLGYMGLAEAHHPQIANLSVYMSDKGCLTNFHWDRSSGIIIQFHGRKRVWMVAPENDSFMISKDANRSISSCYRRSRFTGREELPEVDHTSVIIGPGEALFIPPFWWHQV